MTNTEFVALTAVMLFFAFCLGWFANWLVHRFSRVAADDVAQLDRMSQELHEAEETRDQAITYLQQREAELTNQLAQTEPGGVFASVRMCTRCNRLENLPTQR